MIIKQYLLMRGETASSLADQLGVPVSTVTRWLHGQRRISAEMAVAVEKVTGIRRHHLRPDLFEEKRYA
jgi:DNA-binding transcriptional regulator YdaS (Cro superfamily)